MRQTIPVGTGRPAPRYHDPKLRGNSCVVTPRGLKPAARFGCKIANGPVAIILLIGTAGGCLGPRRDDYRSSQAVAIADRSTEAGQFWDAIQETLRRHRFRLDRVDRRAGVITTFPVASQHLFEVWRHDVNTWSDLWESTLNPLRRWVEVSVTRGEGNAWKELAVVVHKERLSSPDRQFNSTGAAYQYFGDRLPSTTGQLRVTAKDVVWLDLGTDPAMEEYLLRAILGRAGHKTDLDKSPGNI